VTTDGSTFLNDIVYTWTGFATNTWYAVAVDYDGTKYRLYVDGVMVGSSSTARVIFDTGENLGIGNNSIASGAFLDGYLDETRITKGVARYASDSGYAVQTSAFPRSVC
jgi:hypothetical protein